MLSTTLTDSFGLFFLIFTRWKCCSRELKNKPFWTQNQLWQWHINYVLFIVYADIELVFDFSLLNVFPIVLSSSFKNKFFLYSLKIYINYVYVTTWLKFMLTNVLFILSYLNLESDRCYVSVNDNKTELLSVKVGKVLRIVRHQLNRWLCLYTKGKTLVTRKISSRKMTNQCLV